MKIPVIRFDTVRVMLSVAAEEKLHVKQFDVKTAFLHGLLEEEIYMDQPEAYNDGTGKVCKLKKSLYGLKQASRCWNKCFVDYLKKMGLHQSDADPCLFFKIGGEKMLLGLYVDDGLVIGSDLNEVNRLLDQLAAEFEITHGESTSYLGVRIRKLDDGSIFIDQAVYANKILQRFGMHESKAVATPIEKASITGEAKMCVREDIPYRSVVGSLMYLAVGTRPDIAFAVNTVSQHLQEPTESDWLAVKRILRYVKGTIDLGIHYQTGKELICYSDADYAGDVSTRRSTTGVVSKYAGGAVTWMSTKQRSVALSTTEAEFVAGSEAAKELVWLRRLYKQVAEEEPHPVLFIDNAGAVKLVKNPEFHKRTKHIDVRYYFIREKYADGVFDVDHIAGEEQVADILTKPLTRVRFVKLRALLGLSQLR